MREDRKDELRALTGLRFVAAFYVFLFHIQIRWPIISNNHEMLKNILDQGAIGMSLFFMLSGFILSYQYADEKTKLKNYFINRFARIYPVYVVAALTTLPWIGVTFYHGSLGGVFKSIAQMFFLILANIVLIQAWITQLFNLWNDGGSWSISVEAFCYVLFPFALPVLLAFSKKQLFVFIGICYLVAVFPGLSVALFSGKTTDVFYSMPVFRLPEFLMGICTYRFIFFDNFKKIGKIFHLIAFGVVLTYLGIFGNSVPTYIGHDFIILPFFAVTIYCLSNQKSIFTGPLSSSVAVWLGKISYCFYSFQGLIILALLSCHDKLIVIFPLLKNNKILCGITLITLIVLSAIGFYFIEEPCRRWIRNQHEKHDASQLNKESSCVGKMQIS